MKLFFLIFLPFFSLAQASTYEAGDSTWVTSNDTSKVKVYKGNRPVRIVLDGLLIETLTQAYIDTLKAHGKTIHYTNGGSVEYTRGRPDSIAWWENSEKVSSILKQIVKKDDKIYVEEGRPKYLATSDAKESESIYDIYPTIISTYLNYTDELPAPKYDTIGPFWHQVSDTTAGYNPVMAMQLFEVRVYKNEWITKDPNIIKGGSPSYMEVPKEQQLTPHHFAWLDIKKKSFKMKVW